MRARTRMKSAILKYDVTRASFFTRFVSIAKFERAPDAVPVGLAASVRHPELDTVEWQRRIGRHADFRRRFYATSVAYSRYLAATCYRPRSNARSVPGDRGSSVRLPSIAQGSPIVRMNARARTRIGRNRQREVAGRRIVRGQSSFARDHRRQTRRRRYRLKYFEIRYGEY
jgi:hypothetical protein